METRNGRSPIVNGEADTIKVTAHLAVVGAHFTKVIPPCDKVSQEIKMVMHPFLQVTHHLAVVKSHLFKLNAHFGVVRTADEVGGPPRPTLQHRKAEAPTGLGILVRIGKEEHGTGGGSPSQKCTVNMPRLCPATPKDVDYNDSSPGKGYA